MRWRAIVLGVVAVLATPIAAGAATSPAVDTCRVVTLADARSLLGDDRAAAIPGTEPACVYHAPGATPGDAGAGLLVQLTRRARPPSVPSFASPLRIPGGRVCWTVPLSQGVNVSCFARRRLVSVNVFGASDDLATATSAMGVALRSVRKR